MGPGGGVRFPSMATQLLILLLYTPGYCLLPLRMSMSLDKNLSSLFQASKKLADAKLTKDYQSVLKDFEKTQKLAAKRETAYVPNGNLSSR